MKATEFFPGYDKTRNMFFFMKTKRGMTLIDVVVGTSIMLIVFLGIFGAFKISIQLVYSTKAKTGAVSLLTEQLEYIRGLPYENVGTFGGIPAGVIPQTEQVHLNGVDYIRNTLVQYTDAPEDGLDTLDENGITADYKTVKVEIVWNIRNSNRSTFAVTRIAPIGQESLTGGGTLRVNVFDQSVSPVEGATVRIVNSTSNPTIDVSAETNTAGSVSFPGTPEGSEYEIYVSKSGYSSAQTYGVSAGNPNPSPIHVSVVESQTTTTSFGIDRDAVLRFFTYEPAGPGSFDDTFADETKLMSIEGLSVSGGVLALNENPATGYTASGSAFSIAVAPAYLASWDEIAFTPTTPADTALAVRLHYFDGSVYALVPDTDLPNNSSGFTSGLVDISSLDIATYASLKLGAFLETADASSTPQLSDWSLSYIAGPSPLPGVSFNIHGAKTIGTDSGGQPVYKYDDAFTTTQYAEWFIDPIEWDAYTVALSDSDEYDVVERCPNVVAPNPGETLDVSVTVDTDTSNSLRVSVTDEVGDVVNGATITLAGPTSVGGLTEGCGQEYFGGITQGTYSITISKSGFQTYAEDIGVSGETEYSISLLSN